MPMFHARSRHDLRSAYLAAWRKAQAGDTLTPLEAQIAQVVAEHPEYHPMLEGPPEVLEAQFPPEAGAENPFLHLGLHLAVREQVSTDRPPGIARIHSRLSARLGSAHVAEHRMFEVLGRLLWEAERAGQAPDESTYLEQLQRLMPD
ncbi:MAG TPA: DUF1841 family protein [Steroidobacteraceae bacterium]|nr:DUF1841 family protein [Steroidobacteraceae bacterium]